MFYYKNESYDLPKKTMALNDKIEAVNNAKTTKEAYKCMLEFVILGLGKPKVKELLGTDNINQVDLTELNILSNAIILGYEKKIAKQQIDVADELVASDTLDKLIQMGQLAKSVKQK